MPMRNQPAYEGARARVAVTRRRLPGTAVERLAQCFDMVVSDGAEPPGPAELRSLVDGADAVLCMAQDVIDEDLLSAGRDLKVVAVASMGYDAIDVAAAGDRAIVVTNAPGVLQETTADLAFTLILMARRRLVSATDALRGGGWTTFRMDDYLGQDVHGAVLGVLGYGQIGRAVARRAKGFGMTVQHHSQGEPSDDVSRAVGFRELLSTSDVVSVHVPLTPATRNLLGAHELGLMKPTATLVNTARGGIVDEHALVEALRSGRLHSAGLDVFVDEPRHRLDDPLFTVENLVVLPHVGSATYQTRARMVDLAADNIIAVLEARDALTPVSGSPSRPSLQAVRVARP